MTTETRYRITGDIIIKNKTPASRKNRGKKVEVSYGTAKTTDLDQVAIIQARKPLTPEAPYFLLEVQKCGKMIGDFHLDKSFQRTCRS